MSAGTELHADHARLEALFQDVINASEANVSTDALGASWTRFEGGVLAHFEAEESELFPVMAETHPDAVSGLKTEHAEIRKLLLDLDMQVDLHVIRHDEITAIIERLRDHAATEDATIYAWAEALPEERRNPIAKAIRSILHRAQ